MNWGRGLALCLFAGAVVTWAPLYCQESVFVFDPAQTQIRWTLDATLHNVHGVFQLRSGTVRFDPATGKAGGRLIVDATSGNSGNGMRDAKMHESVLNSSRFSDVVFVPDRVEGRIPAEGEGDVQVHGVFTLQGVDHEMMLPMRVARRPNGVSASSHFVIPYVSWGLKNPSTFVLRVSDKVEIEIQAMGRISTNGGH